MVLVYTHDHQSIATCGEARRTKKGATVIKRIDAFLHENRLKKSGAPQSGEVKREGDALQVCDIMKAVAKVKAELLRNT